jgi:hypothetical protein
MNTSSSSRARIAAAARLFRLKRETANPIQAPIPPASLPRLSLKLTPAPACDAPGQAAQICPGERLRRQKES